MNVNKIISFNKNLLDKTICVYYFFKKNAKRNR